MSGHFNRGLGLCFQHGFHGSQYAQVAQAMLQRHSHLLDLPCNMLIPTFPHPQIERKAAIRNFEGIAHVADGIIISRGNLGLDFEAEVRCWRNISYTW